MKTLINKLQSYLYRSILVALALLIASAGGGDLPQFVYLVVTTAYILLSWVFHHLVDRSYLRQITDFSYIVFILWNYGIESPLNYFLAIFPLISTIYYSGQKKSFLPVALFTTFVVAYFSHWSWLCLVPIIVLVVAIMLSRFVYKRENLIHELLTEIDGYYTDPDELKQMHHLYIRQIQLINKYFDKKNLIKSIRAYKYNEDGVMWLINSSYVEYQRRVVLDEETVSWINSSESSDQGNLLNINSKVCSVYYTTREQNKYVFVIELDGLPSGLLYELKGYDYVMHTVLGKMAHLLNMEYNLRQYKNKKFEELRGQYEYVSTARSLMHFLRNQLTPFKNILEFEENKDKYANKRPEFEKLLEKEYSMARSSLEDIKRTAAYLLDRNNDPVTSCKDFSLNMMYVITSEIVQQHLNTDVFTKEGFIGKMQQNDKNYRVHCKSIESKIMLTDWAENIAKYNEGQYFVSIDVEDESLILQFVNSHKLSESEKIQLIKDLNSTDKEAILENRKSYGIYYIVRSAQNQDVKIKAENIATYTKPNNEVINNAIQLTFIYKLYEKEDTNI